MGGVNKVFLMGNVGQDPEIRQTAGSTVLSLRLATTTTYYNNTTKQRAEDTQWHNVVMWGPRAESLGKILVRGSCIHVEGRLQNRDWQDKQGNKRTTTEVVAQEIEFAGPKTGGGRRGGYEQETHSEPQGSVIDDDNIPF